jgi:hypothetical protein
MAFKEYQREVFARTEARVESMDPADFERVVIARPFPGQIASTFSAICAGPAGITVLDGFECWIYQHGFAPPRRDRDPARPRRTGRHDVVKPRVVLSMAADVPLASVRVRRRQPPESG